MIIEQTISAYEHFTALAQIIVISDNAPKIAWNGLQAYKKLLNLEQRMHRIAEMECNGEGDQARHDKNWSALKEQVKALILPQFHVFLHFNGDPRGYVLKIDPKDLKIGGDMEKILHGMHRDFGGYYILAPDF